MQKSPFLIALTLCAATVLGADEKKIPPMPAAVSGNAVASLKDGLEIFSMMGVGPRKTWDDVTNQVYIMDLAHAKWREGRTVPGVVGRLNSSAAPRYPGLMTWKMLQRSASRFSTGVPVSATRHRAPMARAACAARVDAFFTFWASSRTSPSHLTCVRTGSSR